MAGCDDLDKSVMEKIDVVAVVGPTACGKTKLSIKLAKQLNGEIISADSIQTYKEMNIGTAKPTKAEMSGVPHYLIDFLDINDEFSVAEYVKLAKKCIFEVNARGKLPFIVGGTGLYVNSLLSNISFTEQKFDPTLREDLFLRLKNEGVESLIDELSEFDKESAQKIHPHNVIRIIRAIEFYRMTGTTITQHIKDSKKIISPYNPIMFGLTYRNREILYDKINKRVDKMMDLGLADEAKKILSSKCSKTAMNAICYKEFIPYFRNQCSLNEVVENLKRQTRRYAKRQLTWFKKDARINWIFVDDYINFKEILNFCTKTIEKQKNM